MGKPGVIFYFDVRPCIKRLSLEEKGLLFEAILDYAEFGAVPDLDGALGVAWDFIQPRLDSDSARYDKRVEQTQYAVFSREIKKRGGAPPSFNEWKALSDTERNRLISADTGRYPTTTTTSTSTTTSTTTSTGIIGPDKPPSRHRFVPPSVDEVCTYCQENGYTLVDPERFVNFYQSKGWKVGKESMKDWRAAVRNWNSRDKGNSVQNSGKPLLGYKEGEKWTL